MLHEPVRNAQTRRSRVLLVDDLDFEITHVLRGNDHRPNESLHRALSLALRLARHRELKQLADTIDELLGRLESAFAAQRRFVANASHELRTPLATMRASLDVAMAKPEPGPEHTQVLASRLRTELDRIDELLEGFLVLARAQHGVLPDGGTFALSGNIDVLTAVTRVIRGKWMSVRYDPKDPNNSVVVEPLDEYFRGLMPTQAFHVMQYEPEESIFELPAPPQSGKRE